MTALFGRRLLFVSGQRQITNMWQTTELKRKQSGRIHVCLLHNQANANAKPESTDWLQLCETAGWRKAEVETCGFIRTLRGFLSILASHTCTLPVLHVFPQSSCVKTGWVCWEEEATCVTKRGKLCHSPHKRHKEWKEINEQHPEGTDGSASQSESFGFCTEAVKTKLSELSTEGGTFKNSQTTKTVCQER